MTALPADPTKLYLDSAADDPKLARGELATLVDTVAAALAHLRASVLLSDASAPAGLGDGVELAANLLRIKLDGASLGRSGLGLKLADTAVTPGSYTNTALTVNSRGQITAAANGAVVSPGWVPLAELTAAASASLDFTNVISTTYDAYALVLDKLRLSTDQAELRLRVSSDNGASWKSTSYNYASTGIESGAGGGINQSSGNASSVVIGRTSGNGSSIGNNAADSLAAHIWLWPNGSTKYKPVLFQSGHSRMTAGALTSMNGLGAWIGTSQINAVQLLPSSGTITDGKARIYGIKNS